MSLFIVVEVGGASDNVMSGKFLGISEIRANGQALELKGTAACGPITWEQASWRPGSFDAGKLWDSSIGEWGAWAYPVDTVMSDKYLGISEARINGEPIPMNGTAVMDSPQWTEGYYHSFKYTDAYAILDHSNPPASSNTHPTWDCSPAARPVVDLSTVGTINTIEVDFFVTGTQGVKPPVKDAVPEVVPTVTPVWSGKNTVGLAGLELRDLGIADDWNTIVPVDLIKEGWSVYPLLVSNAYIIGNAFVCVHNGEVSVTVDYVGNSHTYIIKYSECVKWFTDLDDITPEALISIDDGLTCADVVSIADDLGGADLAYLSINNKVSYRTPIDKMGSVLPRYWRDQAQWIAHLDALKAMIPAE